MSKKHYPLSYQEILWALHQTYGSVQSDETLRHDLKEFIAGKQREAWQYGYQASLNDKHSPLYRSPNPYAKEEA